MRNTNVLSGLCLMFVFLKLIGAIEWSWWWVVSPLWLPFAIVITLCIFGCAIVILVGLVMMVLDWYDTYKS